jgi:hypothetical protein
MEVHLMRFKVKIFKNGNEIISEDIWYGKDLDNVRYWIDLAIQDIINKLGVSNLSYDVEMADEQFL